MTKVYNGLLLLGVVSAFKICPLYVKMEVDYSYRSPSPVKED